MMSLLNFPTELHRRVAEFARDFFLTRGCVDTILVVNSCARGVAVPESDLDLAVLVKPTTSKPDVRNLEALWQEVLVSEPLILEFQRSGPFTQVHLDCFDGRFSPGEWDDGGGPDCFEVEIGNRIAYSAPLHQAGSYFQQLRSLWLPYYDDNLRLHRLTMVSKSCEYDLDHVPHYLKRGLHFQAFDRLYKAFQEFLQALCISRRTYPLAYNKWVREQVQNRLGLLEVCRELPPILSVSNLESTDLSVKADALRMLLERWAQP